MIGLQLLPSWGDFAEPAEGSLMRSGRPAPVAAGVESSPFGLEPAVVRYSQPHVYYTFVALAGLE